MCRWRGTCTWECAFTFVDSLHSCGVYGIQSLISIQVHGSMALSTVISVDEKLILLRPCERTQPWIWGADKHWNWNICAFRHNIYHLSLTLTKVVVLSKPQAGLWWGSSLDKRQNLPWLSLQSSFLNSVEPHLSYDSSAITTIQSHWRFQKNIRDNVWPSFNICCCSLV